jgi:redox-sensitive bicupin YhaK (pirin superfamily)
MITVRKSSERGHANHGWLDSYHTFSFAGYHDPAHMGFRSLRVINQDQVAPGEGFGTHSHSDMEIISYVVEGKLSHKDSMGTVATLKRGDVQVMSAGTGITHSEFNGGNDAPVRFLQLWIMPDQRRHTPRYADKTFGDKKNRLQIIASPDARDGSLPIHQDALIFASELDEGKTLEHRLQRPHGWLQLISGALTLNGVSLQAGDGAQLSDEATLQITANAASEFLLFDLA